MEDEEETEAPGSRKRERSSPDRASPGGEQAEDGVWPDPGKTKRRKGVGGSSLSGETTTAATALGAVRQESSDEGQTDTRQTADDVEEGGGTQFPYLNVTVKPKKGMAALWPHGMNSNPRVKDSRTHHEAMPVIKVRHN